MNVAYLFNRTLGISSLLKTIWGACSFPPVPVLKLVFLYTSDGCLRESLELSKEAKPNVLYDVEWEIALKPMQGNWSSFQVDLGDTELFHIPPVTSVSF